MPAKLTPVKIAFTKDRQRPMDLGTTIRYTCGNGHCWDCEPWYAVDNERCPMCGDLWERRTEFTSATTDD